MSESLLKMRIEQLRELMTALALEKGSFVDHEVVILSQQLDSYIVQLQLRRKPVSVSRKEANAC